MPGTADLPFTGPPVPAIELDPPPLARVLAQIRFSPMLQVADEAIAGQVQTHFSEDYPLARADVEVSIALSAAGTPAPALAPTRVWRYNDVDENWRVSLTTNFVALECERYPGHEEFFSRFERVLTVVAEVVSPGLVERTGVRYVQRLRGSEDLARIAEYVRPEVVGVCAIQDDGANLALCFTQAQAMMAGVQLSARWGLLPAGVAVDPAIPPMDERSWVMDIDVFDEHRDHFDPTALSQRAFEHSRRQYRFFRWAVEPSFLLRFGADQALVDRLGAA